MTHVAHALPPRPDATLRAILVGAFLLALLLAAGKANAAPAEPRGEAKVQVADAEAPAAPSRKRTVLRFGDDNIHGDLTRPDGELVQAPRHPAQPTLLRVR